MNVFAQIAKLNAEDKASNKRSEDADKTTKMSIQVLKGLNSCPALPEIHEVKDGARASA